MQKLTHKKIHQIEERLKRVEKIMIATAGALISGMDIVILVLLEKL